MNFDDYPATDWGLQAVIRGPSVINLDAAPNGSAFDFSVDSSVTAGWLPGVYWYSLRASNGVDTFEISTGELKVLQDLASAEAGYDGRSQNEIALAAIEAVLARRATLDQQRYSINNRELWRTPIPELLQLQAFYRVRVRRERAAKKGSGTFGRSIRVRFS